MTLLIALFFVMLLEATPLDLGVVAQGLIDKSVAISVLIGVIYYMLRAFKENKKFYKELRDEDKVESSKEREELYATFSKQENEKKEMQKAFENTINTLLLNHKETISSIVENQSKQTSAFLEKSKATEMRLLDTIASKDEKLIAAYLQNVASVEKLGEMLKLFSEIQAEFTGKITESIHSKFEQIFQVLRSAKSS